jgi:imidazolonepropionase-like amidohydrolase
MLASFNGTLSADSLKQDAALQVLPVRWREALLKRAHAAAWPGAARAARAAEVRRRLVRAFITAGARVAPGVDVASSGYNVPGAGVHRELVMLVAAGLSPAVVIRAATVNCAELVGAGDSLGQITAGFRADLIAVEGDPLAKIEDLQRITLIVRGGEVLDRDQLLAQARRAIR